MKYYISLFFAILWIDSCSGLFYQIFPILEKFSSLLFFSCHFGIILLALTTLRHRSLKYLVLFFSIILIGLIPYTYEDGITIVQFLNGSRDFVPLFFSLIFITNMLYSNHRVIFYQKMNKFILYFLCVQVPICIVQFFIYGMGDEVGGTGGSFGSGNISILIYTGTFYLLSQTANTKKLLEVLFKNKYLLLLWIPSLINETKVTFLLIPLFFLMCFEYNFRKIIRNIPVILIGIIFSFAFLQMYQYFNEDRSLAEVMQGGYIIEYDLEKSYETIEKYGDELGKYTDSRTLRLILGMLELSKNNMSLIFGKSLGHFKGGTIGQTKFAKENEYVTGRGSKSFILVGLMQIGIVGTILVYLAIFIGLSKRNEKLPSLENNNSKMRCFLLLVTIGISYYSTAFLSFYLSAMFFYIGIVSTLPNSIMEQLKAQPFYSKRKQYSILKHLYLPKANLSAA